MASMAVEDKSVAAASTVVVDGTFDGTVDWAAVAVEIRPQGSTPKEAGAVEEEETKKTAGGIGRYRLHPAYPNPFNAQTAIIYELPSPSHVRLSVYDVLGRRLKVLLDEEQRAGVYEVQWDGRDEMGQPLASGVYVCRMEAGRFRSSRKLLMIR